MKETTVMGLPDETLHAFTRLREAMASRINDPVPRFLWEKHLLGTQSDDEVFQKTKADLAGSRWLGQLKEDQLANGSWGRFHTQDTKSPKQTFVTTEAALRRMRDLSLDADDLPLKATVGLMERYLLRTENWIDVREKGKWFDIGFPTLIAANLHRVVPRHPLVQPYLEAAAELGSYAARGGVFDELAWRFLVQNGFEIGLEPFMGYPAWLLQNNPYFPRCFEKTYLQYLWKRPQGIYYITGFPLSQRPTMESPLFTQWLSGLEAVADFRSFPEVLVEENALAALAREAEKLLNGFADWPHPEPIQGHYCEDWRHADNRRIDMALRILRLIAKLH